MSIALPDPKKPASPWSRLVAPPPGITWSAVAFALRTTAASLVALYIAFLLDLDSPKWAAMTVWIVARGSRGMTLSKSQYRALGTLVGAGVSVLLVALFAQTPALFLPSLALWLGLCTAVATALRNFRAYGAVLSGYTAMIIAMDSVAAPQHVFDIAVARVTYVLLGITTEAVFTALLAPGAPHVEVRQRLDSYSRKAAGVCARALRGEAVAGASLHRLFAGAVALNTLAEHATAASGAARRQLGHLRAAITATLAQLAAAQMLREHLSNPPGGPAAALIADAAAMLDAAATARAGAVAVVATLRERVETAFADEAARGAPVSTLLLLDRLEALLSALHQALARQALLALPKPPPSRLGFAFHIDRTAVVQNGIRATVAVLAASAFWILTAWPSGSGFVTIVGVVCALFAIRDNPVAGGLGFLKGAAYACMGAGLYNFAVMPAISGFPMLAVALGTCLVGTGIAMRNPRTAASASIFAIFFLDLVGPENTTRMMASGFFNGSLALLLGMVCGTLVFTLLFPPNPRASRARLHRAARHDLARIGQDPGAWSAERWLSRMADRLGRQLATATIVPPDQAEADLHGMLAALTIGDAAIRLHGLAETSAGARQPVAMVLRRLDHFDPDRLSRTARMAAARLARQAARARPDEARRLRRGVVWLREMADATAAHAAFLRG